MTWWNALVQISSGGQKGSGVLVRPNVVLTAGHVVQPAGGSAASAATIHVDARYAQQVLTVGGVFVHARWAASNDPAADIALLKVAATALVPLTPAVDFGADFQQKSVAAAGFDAATDQVWHVAGTIVRGAHVAGFDMFTSADLRPPPGASGGPIVWQRPNDVGVVGVTTWQGSGAGATFVGLPLLGLTYQALLALVGP